jgi:hypothetical protein
MADSVLLIYHVCNVRVNNKFKKKRKKEAICIYNMWPKALAHVKKNPYVINQNHILIFVYYEVILIDYIENCLHEPILLTTYIQISPSNKKI